GATCDDFRLYALARRIHGVSVDGSKYTVRPPAILCAQRAHTRHDLCAGREQIVGRACKQIRTAMADSALPLYPTGFPPAIDVTPPANPQVFTLQLSLANTSRSTDGNPGETVTVQNALLLVPVTLPPPAFNLAATAAMTPGVADDKQWKLSPVSLPD